MQQFNNNINDGKTIIENELQQASRMGSPCSPSCSAQPQTALESSNHCLCSQERERNSSRAAQSRVKIWASKGNHVARLLQNHRGWKGTDRSNMRFGPWESLTPLCFTQDPVIEFLHKPFFLGVCDMRCRPEQIPENSQFWAPIIH